MASFPTKVVKTNITKLFDAMDYNDTVTEDLGQAKKWFEQKSSLPFSVKTELTSKIEVHDINEADIMYNVYMYDENVIHDVIENASTCDGWSKLKATERARILNIFAQEISKNSELIIQLELSIRGILRRDTAENALPLLIGCMKFYSSLALLPSKQMSVDGQGVALLSLSDKSFLGLLGLALGPALAAGYNVILQGETKLMAVLSFIAQLSNKAGIPEGVIQAIPACVNTDVYLKSSKINIIYEMDNKHRANYNTPNMVPSKLVAYTPMKIPMVIFDDADINSAVDAAVKGVWEYQGNLPWSINNIIVQENIAPKLIEKLKDKINHIKIGPSNNKQTDVTYPVNENTLLELNVATSSAKQQGIEVFQSSSNFKGFVPTLLVGEICLSSNNLPLANVVTFRTINEAVTLANNSRQGFGVTVWTENISRANEVYKKLNVSNIWFNMNGLLLPHIPFSALKENGVGSFGGREGLNECFKFCQEKNMDEILHLESSTTDSKIAATVSSAINAQKVWSKISSQDRSQKFRDLIEYISAQKSSSTNLQQLQDEVYQTLLQETDINYVFANENLEVRTYRLPLGVIAVNIDNKLSVNFILATLLFGNSVIVLIKDSQQGLEFYTDFTKCLRQCNFPNILNVISYSNTAFNTLVHHKQVTRYFYYAPPNVSGVNEILKFVNHVSYTKSVWSTAGQSFI